VLHWARVCAAAPNVPSFAPAATGAPTGFGGFGAAPAPAPATGFGATFGAPGGATSQPMFGGGFGMATAASAPMFGGAPAPAPAVASFGGFGAPAPAPFAFGGTTFGAPAPAPAPAAGFAGPFCVVGFVRVCLKLADCAFPSGWCWCGEHRIWIRVRCSSTCSCCLWGTTDFHRIQHVRCHVRSPVCLWWIDVICSTSPRTCGWVWRVWHNSARVPSDVRWFSRIRWLWHIRSAQSVLLSVRAGFGVQADTVFVAGSGGFAFGSSAAAAPAPARESCSPLNCTGNGFLFTSCVVVCAQLCLEGLGRHQPCQASAGLAVCPPR
jgi:hypothetical protein